MKSSFTQGIALAALGAVALGFTACGKSNEKAEDTAKAINGLMSKTKTAGGASTVSRNVRMQAVEMRKNAEGQALLSRFALQADQAQTGRVVYAASGDADYSCTLDITEADVTTSSSSSSDAAAAASVPTFDLSCTTTAEDSFSCKDVEYTVAKGATFGMVTKLKNESTYELDFDMKATVTGGTLSATDLNCHFEFTWDLEALTDDDVENDDETAIDCSNSSNKCTFGGEQITCEDFNDEKDDEDNAC